MKIDFIKSFKLADMIFVLPVYTAGEKRDNEVNQNYLIRTFSKKYRNKFISLAQDNNNFYNYLRDILSKGDNIIFLGAGNSSKIAHKFSNFLSDHEH